MFYDHLAILRILEITKSAAAFDAIRALDFDAAPDAVRIFPAYDNSLARLACRGRYAWSSVVQRTACSPAEGMTT